MKRKGKGEWLRYKNIAITELIHITKDRGRMKQLIIFAQFHCSSLKYKFIIAQPHGLRKHKTLRTKQVHCLII
jgi:hypothetical protein